MCKLISIGLCLWVCRVELHLYVCKEYFCESVLGWLSSIFLCCIDLYVGGANVFLCMCVYVELCCGSICVQR